MSVDVKYSTTATATGGRDGQARSEDGRFAVALSTRADPLRAAGAAPPLPLVVDEALAGLAAASRDVKDSAEHKERQAQAQFAVPAADLVEGVKRVLKRHS